MSDLIRDHYKWSCRIRWIQLLVNAVCACVHFVLGQYIVIFAQMFFSIYVFIVMDTRLAGIAATQLFDVGAAMPDVKGKRRTEYLALVDLKIRELKLEPTLEALEAKLHLQISAMAVMKLKNKHTTLPNEYAACLENQKLYQRLIEHLHSTNTKPPA